MGIDINQVEINQARRIFKKENLQFRSTDFNPEKFPETRFDVVVFAASLQYFSPLKTMLQKVQQCLTANGEIHVLDTLFYSSASVADAIKRTESYFSNQGYPEMASCYFHHQLDDLRGFNFKILFNPNNMINKLLKKDPFYWICINR
jgi:ubiquinone/menaquinone biosynthesis C-methylase UbiE